MFYKEHYFPLFCKHLVIIRVQLTKKYPTHTFTTVHVRTYLNVSAVIKIVIFITRVQNKPSLLQQPDQLKRNPF